MGCVCNPLLQIMTWFFSFFLYYKKHLYIQTISKTMSLLFWPILMENATIVAYGSVASSH